MTSIGLEQKGDVLIVRISGVVSEETKFPRDSIGSPQSVLVSCDEIRRMNSVGIKNWISFFEEVSKTGARVHFEKCTVPVIQQFNAILNFGAGGKVLSFYIPFYCEKCEHTFQRLHDAKAVLPTLPDYPRATCPECGATAVLDDEPEEYFLFLKRQA